MDLFTRKFATQEVALATGNEAKTVSDWCTKGLIINQRQPLGRGYSREFSFFNIMEIAIAGALMNGGIKSPGDAFRVAQKFSHSGDLGRATWDDGLQDDDPVRHPAVPYHHSLGDTYLVVAGDRCEILLDGLDAQKSLTLHHVEFALGRPESWITVNLSAVFARVIHGLGLGDAHAVLDAAYAIEVR